MEFFIHCFTRTVVRGEYHDAKERVMLAVARIIERHGSEIAFPTRTLHLPDEVQVAQVLAAAR